MLATLKKYWYLFLAGFVVLWIAYLIWRVKRQQSAIDVLEADKKLFEERLKDLELRQKNAKTVEDADALKLEILRLQEKMVMNSIDQKLAAKERDAQKAAVAAASDWVELQKQVGKKP